MAKQDTFLLGSISWHQGMQCPPVGDFCVPLPKSRRKPQNALGHSPYLLSCLPHLPGFLSPPLQKDEAREEILKVVQVHSQEGCWRMGGAEGEKGVETDEVS